MKALLVGINKYLNVNGLQGCVNDVKRMKKLLQKYHGAKDGDIQVLLDHEATAAAIKDRLAWLAQPHDDPGPRLFHYSGHGTQTPDENGDEQDGADECLVPVDYEQDGDQVRNLLVDDDLRKIYATFNKDIPLLLVMDSCHSGTVQRDDLTRLNYRFVKPPPAQRRAIRAAEARNREAQEKAIEHLVESRVAAARGQLTTEQIKQIAKDAVRGYQKKHYGVDVVKGNVVLIAGCRSNQTSADAPFDNDAYQGALTYYLCEALEAEPQLSYDALIVKVGASLETADFEQIPQLECTTANRAKPFLAH